MEARYSVKDRAAVPIAGKTMLQHVVDALRGSSHVGEIYIIGNTQCAGDPKVVEPRGDFTENLVAGVEACSEAERILVATSDIPMVTAEAIDDFIRRCEAVDADFYYPIVAREASERRFPGMHRTYVRIAEGVFTGGNVVLLSRRFVLENAKIIQAVMDARKSPVRLAKVMGVGVLVRAIVAQLIWPGALGLKHLEEVAARILNARVKVVQTPYPEIAADVDRPEQIDTIERYYSMEGDSP